MNKAMIITLLLSPLMAFVSGNAHAQAAESGGDTLADIARNAKVAAIHVRAEQGDAKAQALLGLIYVRGQGVAQDTVTAVNWLRKAAEQGYAAAQYGVGVAYANGEGVPRDDTAAVVWYRKAADQGQAQAKYHLGWMYAEGRGVAHDDILAYALADFGQAKNANGTGLKDLVAERLTPDQKTRGEALSKELVQSGDFIRVLDAYLDGSDR